MADIVGINLNLDTVIKLASVVIAIVGIFVTAYREIVERWLRRRAFVKLLLTDDLVKKYLDEVYCSTVGRRWCNYRKYWLVPTIFVGILAPLACILILTKENIANWDEIFATSLMLSFYFIFSIFAIFSIFLLPMESRHPLFLKILEILKSLIGGLFINSIVSFAIVYRKIPESKILEITTVVLFIFAVIFVVRFTIDRKENMILKHHAKIQKEKKKRLPTIKILLEDGHSEVGKLVEFHDPDFIVIEKEGSELAILWDRIVGIETIRVSTKNK